MKKLFIALFSVMLVLLMSSCGNNTDIKNTVNGNMKTYYEMTDGSWKCGDNVYKYRLEIKGRLNGAVCDSVYVYLSNLPDISFEQAAKASGLSSNSNDYFAARDAVLVEMGTE
ncbi:MAG: immunogenic protein [Ruminiclostridium sp.]|nr:immunogenic protein [Ruminiclostridium sp.]